MGNPVNRAPFNALVDDDGNNTIGSPWNKAAIAGVLLDPVDAALARAGAFPFGLGTALVVPLPGGTYHDLYPGDTTIWGLQPAAPITITGFANPVDGRQFLIINTTAQAITLANQHTGSLPANRMTGPGFVDFALGTWRSVWIVYLAAFGAWIIQGEK